MWALSRMGAGWWVCSVVTSPRHRRQSACPICIRECVHVGRRLGHPTCCDPRRRFNRPPDRWNGAILAEFRAKETS